MSEATIDGSCLCGAVAYRVHGDFEAFYLCHCSRCRKATGSAHASNLFSTTATLEWLRGEEAIRRYKVEGTRFEKCFCGTCGGAVPRVGPGRIMVPAGSLDGAAGVKPNAHIFCGSRADWDDALETAPQIDGSPFSRP